jgi:hypothetical protein
MQPIFRGKIFCKYILPYARPSGTTTFLTRRITFPEFPSTTSPSTNTQPVVTAPTPLITRHSFRPSTSSFSRYCLCELVCRNGVCIFSFYLQVETIISIRDRLNPNVKLDIDEIGVILPNDNDIPYVPFPNIYWNAAGRKNPSSRYLINKSSSLIRW